jgi:drug/metabolite transporter (DMT)-like permease
MKVMQNLSPRAIGTFEMIAAMVLSGTLGFFVFESGQSAWNVVFFRCVFGAVSLALYCWARGMFGQQYFDRNTFLLTLFGGAALVLNWVLLFSSFEYASISIATAVYHTQPFFLIALGVLFLGDRPGPEKLVWFLVAFVGLLCVIEIDTTGANFSAAYAFGLTMAIGAAVLYAIATLVAKQLKGIPPHLLALTQVTLGIFILLPFADFSAVASWGSHWIYLVALGVIHTCVMYILMYSAFQKLPTPAIAVLGFIYPAVAIVVDYAFYDQSLHLVQFFGIGLIMLGSAGVNLGWRALPWRVKPAT